MDEMWTYVNARADGKRQEAWVWTAVVEELDGSRWEACEVGGHDEAPLLRLMERLPDAQRYETDAYAVYKWLPRNRHFVGKGGEVLGRERPVAVLHQMQVLDQQIPPPRPIPEQGADLLERLEADLAPLRSARGAPPSGPRMTPPPGPFRFAGHQPPRPRCRAARKSSRMPRGAVSRRHDPLARAGAGGLDRRGGPRRRGWPTGALAGRSVGRVPEDWHEVDASTMSTPAPLLRSDPSSDARGDSNEFVA